MQINKNQLYTTKEVAETLNVSTITIKRYLANNKLPSIKLCGIRRIAGKDLMKVLSGDDIKIKHTNVELPKRYVEASPYCWVKEPLLIEGKQRCASKYSVIDLFSGAGGFSVGFSRAGFGIALGVDNHIPSKDTFMKNHRKSLFVLGDIRKLDAKQIREIKKKVKPSVIVAGIPCQGFSLNNRKRKEDDERNFLFKEFIRFIRIFKPPYVLLENVSGIRSSGNGYFVEMIKEIIQDCGYDVDFKILNAADYGVPQRRVRVFFMGALPGYKIRWPVPTHGPNREKKYNTTLDAISDLPILKNAQEKTKYRKKPSTEYQKLMRKKAGNMLHNHKSPNHPQSTIDKIAKTIPGKPMYENFPQRIRLKPNDLSPTQVAGGIRSQFTFGHPTQPRGLSIRERARIQSFPDDFVFCGGLVQERVQTGNAVPPLLAQAIAEQIMKGLKHAPMDKRTIEKDPSQMACV